MLPSLSIDRRSIGLGLASTVRAVLELVAPPAPARSGPPLDVVIVLDPTFTAGVDPLVAAAEAAADVLRVARPVDRIGVVAVDHDVVQVLPLGHHDPELATRAIRAWRTDRPGTADGGRAIAAGLLAAAERDGADQRVVVLTDSGPAARLAALFGSVPSARGVMVTVRVSPAVARLHLLDPLPRAATMGAASDDQVEVALGDMFGGETRRLVLALDTHPARSEGLLDLGEGESTGPGPVSIGRPTPSPSRCRSRCMSPETCRSEPLSWGSSRNVAGHMYSAENPDGIPMTSRAESGQSNG